MYSYSFAQFPENIQPSGLCNFNTDDSCIIKFINPYEKIIEQIKKKKLINTLLISDLTNIIFEYNEENNDDEIQLFLDNLINSNLTDFILEYAQEISPKIIIKGSDICTLKEPKYYREISYW